MDLDLEQKYCLIYRVQCTAKRIKIANILLAQVYGLINDKYVAKKAYIEPATNPYNEICNNLSEIVVKSGKCIVA